MAEISINGRPFFLSHSLFMIQFSIFMNFKARTNFHYTSNKRHFKAEVIISTFWSRQLHTMTCVLKKLIVIWSVMIFIKDYAVKGEGWTFRHWDSKLTASLLSGNTKIHNYIDSAMSLDYDEVQNCSLDFVFFNTF